MTDDEWLADFVDRVEECWFRLGMEPSVRRRLVSELETDLAEARAEGASAEELIRTDVVAFAVEVAEANGAELGAGRGARPSTEGIVATSILGGLAGAVLGWFLILTGPVGNTLYDSLGVTGAFISLVLMGLLVVSAMAIAVFGQFHDVRGSGRLTLTSTGLAMAGGAIGLALAVGYGHATNYGTDVGTVFIETTLVATGCAVAIGLGRRRLSSPARSRP